MDFSTITLKIGFRTIFSLIMCCLLCDSSLPYSQCGSAEEGKPHKLIFAWKLHPSRNDGDIYVENNHTTLAVCHAGHTCQVYYPGHYSTEVSTNQSESVTTLRVTIANVSRVIPRIEEMWKVTTNRQVLGCTLKVYSKIKNITCSKHIFTDSIRVTCTSMPLYPQGRCFPYLLQLGFLTSNNDMSYSNEIQLGKPTFYRTTCTLSVPNSNLLKPGVYEVVMIMYPDVSGTDKDIEFGTKSSFLIHIEYPTVTVQTCPRIVIENTTVSCTCIRSDDSDINATVAWYDDEGNLVHDEARLTFTASRNSSSLFCIATNQLGMKGPHLAYRPTIIGKFGPMSCRHHVTPEVVTVSCSNARADRATACLFSINYKHKRIQLKNKTVYMNTMENPKDSFYYSTNCTLVARAINLSPGRYEILATMYPDVTGHEQDLEFDQDHIKCGDQTAEDVVMVWCLSPRMHSEIKCRFLVKDKHIYSTISNSYVVVTNEIQPGYPEYYKSNCTLIFQRKDLNRGNNSLLVTMYHNVTGDTGDLELAFNQSVNIHIESASISHPASQVGVIAYVISANMIILVLGLLTHYRIKALKVAVDDCVPCMKKKTLTNYDELNQRYLATDEISDYIVAGTTHGARSADIIGETPIYELVDVETHNEIDYGLSM